jgi:hypothetical protein
MKLTKIHIFLILLLALVLCSTLGMCSNQGMEGFTSRSDDKRSYESYSNYLTQKNDDNIRSINHSDNRSSNFNNPFHNKANWMSDKDSLRDRDRDRTDLNAGDERDRSNMNTKKTKYSEFHNSDFDSNTKLLDRLVGIFDSVSKGKMNAPMFNVTDTTTNTDANANTNTDANEQQGVPKSRIPPGQENLYILKSEIVPPICPACPPANCGSCANANKCQPCPPCARCPEPSFECKKVPNYNSVGLMNQLPIPWADKL